MDDGLETGPFTPQRLRLFRVAPDIRVFELPVYLFEPVAPVNVVKDTP